MPSELRGDPSHDRFSPLSSLHLRRGAEGGYPEVQAGSVGLGELFPQLRDALGDDRALRAWCLGQEDPDVLLLGACAQVCGPDELPDSRGELVQDLERAVAADLFDELVDVDQSDAQNAEALLIVTLAQIQEPLDHAAEVLRADVVQPFQGGIEVPDVPGPGRQPPLLAQPVGPDLLWL